MVRLIASWVGASAVLVSGCAGTPHPGGGTTAQIWSSDAALTYAIAQVCLPSQAAGRPVAEFAVRPSAMPVSGSSAPSVPGSAWYVGSGTYVVEQSERRGCYIVVNRGDATELRPTAIRLLAEAPYELTQGRSGVAGSGRMLRTTYCGSGAGSLMALMSTSRPGERGTSALQLTIFPRDPASAAAHCAPNGPGDGSERDYSDG